MESILNELSRLFSTYDFLTAVTVILIITLTNLIKRPIVTAATNFAVRSGLDKSIVTKNVMYIPYAIAFILNFIFTLVRVEFRFALVDFKEVVAVTVTTATLAIGLYEIIKKQLEAYASKKNQVPENKQVQLPPKTPEEKEVPNEPLL
ncbi:MAG: hypothetical protein HF308_20300 [Ignavibacteria bacterium]|jgi:hypothetical protein|nr:hypothetical protein [Ignavibacteria bacterium]MCU7526818.1 hypothetical protein [Ignavibacteria bacterium]